MVRWPFHNSPFHSSTIPQRPFRNRTIPQTPFHSPGHSTTDRSTTSRCEIGDSAMFGRATAGSAPADRSTPFHVVPRRSTSFHVVPRCSTPFLRACSRPAQELPAASAVDPPRCAERPHQTRRRGATAAPPAGEAEKPRLRGGFRGRRRRRRRRRRPAEGVVAGEPRVDVIAGHHGRQSPPDVVARCRYVSSGGPRDPSPPPHTPRPPPHAPHREYRGLRQRPTRCAFRVTVSQRAIFLQM